MIKNPYMWISSIFTRNKKSMKDLSFTTEQIKIWNEFYTDYRQYIESKTAYLIRYEDLIHDVDNALGYISKEFNLKRKFENSFELENKKLRANGDTTICNCYDRPFDKQRYINPDILKIIPKNIIETINANIDHSLMEFYRYKIVQI